MAGYSGTPLVKKLGIKPGARVQFLNAPAELEIADLTAEAKPVRSGDLDFALLFVKSAAELQKALPPLLARVTQGGMVWISWPKKASGVATDLTEDVVRNAGLRLTWVDVKVCAIDETWSGLKFYRRKAQARAAARK
ncbi:MAG TPA: DUF3052 domain-containing protein [Terriglobales bacterium]|jgi:hypothetical protein|nr:DUF3052 domain-containing protein [Terriglobales bacterium]